eukprot:5521006-Pyramimonas_sp.AAC.1
MNTTPCALNDNDARLNSVANVLEPVLLQHTETIVRGNKEHVSDHGMHCASKKRVPTALMPCA